MMGRASSLLLLGWLAISASAVVEGARGEGAAEPSRYTSEGSSWSLTVPSGWYVADTSGPEVAFVTPGRMAACGVAVPAEGFESLEEMRVHLVGGGSDSLLRGRETGGTPEVLYAGHTELPSGFRAHEVRLESDGLRSRWILVSRGERAYLLRCETYAYAWKHFEPVFDTLLRSFHLQPCPDGRQDGR